MPYSETIKHVEPRCTDEGNGCGYHEPHIHGLMCNETCTECNALCHPNCPAYSQVRRSNAAVEAFLNGAVDAKVEFVTYIDGEKSNGSDQ